MQQAIAERRSFEPHGNSTMKLLVRLVQYLTQNRTNQLVRIANPNEPLETNPKPSQ